MSTAKYGLGLDQGVASIGWALVRLDETGTPCGIERMGTHCFDAGTDGDIERGKDTSRAKPRRDARQLRKQYRRRVLRKVQLLRWLQELGLLPAGDIQTAEGRDRLLKGLDESLRAAWEPAGTTDHRTRQLLPYRIRAEGLRRRLEPYELGRALYHLAQRRGFLSNRRAEKASPDPEEAKAAPKKARTQSRGSAVPPEEARDNAKAEDAGVVRAAIVELQRQMEGAGLRTLAEYFVTLDPTGTLEDRLRGRWTAREMFMEEFGRLLTEQSRHHPRLTEEARRNLHRAIFFQRPLRSSAHLVGKCELVEGERRLPLGHRMAQRFRMLQKVNDLLIRLPDLTTRPLSRAERDRLIDALNRRSHINFSELKRKAWFDLPKGAKFNLEEGDETRIVGNRTEAKCRAIFGDERWEAMSEREKDAVVHDLLTFQKPAALALRGETFWGLSPEAAQRLSECVLEPGYAAHSKAAFERLLPRMEEGTPYATARKEEFPAAERSSAGLDLLPPAALSAGQGAQRNPAVMRALTELRKLVNAIVRRYGKPEWIRVELARDLKRAGKERERMSVEMRAREKERDAARAAVEGVLGGVGVARASAADIERVLLAQECGWVCPYTGRNFGMADVIGRHPKVDVEHVWPLSRSLDDSFLNKTLCFAEANREKGNRTPYEAYAQDPARWEAMLDRVRRFNGDVRTRREKLERFQAAEIPEDRQPERRLVETRKIGAETAEYLGLLYDGGAVPVGAKQRVFATAGGLTAHLRREWRLGGVLDDVQAMEGGEADGGGSARAERPRGKNRDDHRHHAIDALVVALTDSRTVQRLQRAAEEASRVGRRLFAPVEEPWENFVPSVREHVAAINVSFRQNRRYAGKLHKETNYSRMIQTPQGMQRRVRKELAKLTEKDIDNIVDPKVREAVKKQIKELGLTPQRGCYTGFAARETHPFTTTRAGGKNWIHKVRVVVQDKFWPVGKGPTLRCVESTGRGNHHAVIARDESGKWTDTVVPLIDLKKPTASSPVPKRPYGGDVFTLAAGEFVMLRDKAGRERLLRVSSLSAGDIFLLLHSDARQVKAIQKSGMLVRRSGSGLIRDGARKVSVTYLGEIRRAGG